MKQGFIRVAAATPKIEVANPKYNAKQILGLMKQGAKEKAKIMEIGRASCRERV